METQPLLILVSLEAFAFLVVILTITYDLVRRSREHERGLASQLETFLGPRHIDGDEGGFTGFAHAVRESAVLAFDQNGWSGVAYVYAMAWGAYLLVCGLTIGSIALTQNFVG